MGKYWRLNLSLNLENPMHKAVWEMMAAIPAGYRTEFVCRAILAQKEQETLKTTLREVIQEELKYVSISAETKQEPQDDDDAVLGFLRALQEGGD